MKDRLKINSFPEKNMLINLPHVTFLNLKFGIGGVYYIVRQVLYCFKYLCNMKDCPRSVNFAEMNMLTNLPHATFLKFQFCDMRCVLYCKSVSLLFQILV